MREAVLVQELGQMIGGLTEPIDDDGLLNVMPLTLERDFPLTRLSQACPS